MRRAPVGPSARWRRGAAGWPRSSASRGLGLRQERDELERWELGQDPVALVLHNCAEYLEAMLGCFRARAVPFNVNQHYRDRRDHRAARRRRRPGRDLPPAPTRPLRGGRRATSPTVTLDRPRRRVGRRAAARAAPPTRTRWRRRSAALPEPSPDDLYMVCTGGTTGRPKAVLWRQADIYVSAMAGRRGGHGRVDRRRRRPGWSAGPWYAMPPLMHAAAQWTAFCGLHIGATVLLHDDSQPFDAGDGARAAPSASGSSSCRSWATPTPARWSRSSAGTPTTCRACSRSAPAARPPASSTRRRSSSCCPTSRSGTATAPSETGGMAFGARASQDARRELRARAGGGGGDVGRPHPVPRTRRRRGRLGRPPGPGARSATSATASRPRRPSRSSTASGSPSPATAAGCWPTASIALLGPRLDGGQHRRREGLRRGGRGGPPHPPRRRRRPRRRPALGALRPGGRRGGVAAGRARPSTRPSSASSSPPSSPASRRRAPWPCATRCQRLANGKADYVWAKEVAPHAVDATDARPEPRRLRGRGSGTSKCSSRSSKARLGAVLGAGLHEVELALVELEVGAVGVEQRAEHLLAL